MGLYQILDSKVSLQDLVFLSPREHNYSFKSHSNFSCTFDRLMGQMCSSFKQYFFVALKGLIGKSTRWEPVLNFTAKIYIHLIILTSIDLRVKTVGLPAWTQNWFSDSSSIIFTIISELLGMFSFWFVKDNWLLSHCTMVSRMLNS